MLRVSCTVAEEDVEDAMDVLLPRLPQGVHERDAGEGRRELSWFGGGRFETELGGVARGWSVQDAPAERAERERRYGQAWVLAGRLVVRGPGRRKGRRGYRRW